MILAVDVHYDDPTDTAQAAGVVFARWDDTKPMYSVTRIHRGLERYEPGLFFKRELPCILPLVHQAARMYEIDTIVIDGFVDLDEGRPGFGRHLFVALEEKVTVVGVAKSAFDGALPLPVVRGRSSKPLWVTSTSNVHDAARHIASMARHIFTRFIALDR